MSDEEDYDAEFAPREEEDEGGEGEEDEGEKEEGEEAGEEEQEEPEEPEEAVPDNPLKEETIAECLSLLCKTGDGLAHAYVRLDVHEKELTDIYMLSTFIHLRYVDLTANFLKDISSLNSLTHLLTLKADGNRLPVAKLEEMPYLQHATFNNNQIKSLECLSHPLLEHLSVNFNRVSLISGLEPEKLTRLHTLELRGNRLTSTAGLHLPNLKNLFLAANKIKVLEDMDHLEQLATLHLRDNQIESLNGFTEKLKNLQYVNFRMNSIQNLKEEVPKLDVLPNLRAVVFAENPMSEEDDYRPEILIALRRLERLDKEQYTDEERKEAQDAYEVRKQEQLEREQAEKEAKELEEAQKQAEEALVKDAGDEEEQQEVEEADDQQLQQPADDGEAGGEASADAAEQDDADAQEEDE